MGRCAKQAGYTRVALRLGRAANSFNRNLRRSFSGGIEAGVLDNFKESWKRPVVPAPVNAHRKEHGHE
jgi:hypothetical protein